MTEAIYLEVTEMAETAHKAKHRVSVSGMLKHLGVSRSGYHAWLKRVPSNTEKRREAVEYSNAIVHAFQKFKAPFSGKIVHIFPEQSAVI